MRRWRLVIAVGLVAAVLAACGRHSELEADSPPTTRSRFPAAVVPTSTPDVTNPFGGGPAHATTTTARRPSSGGGKAAPTTTPVTRAPRVPPAATPMPAPRTAVGSAAWKGLVVIAGGYDLSGAVSARVDAYNPASGAWDRAPDLPMALHDVALAVLGDDLWAIGGFTVEGDQSIARAETYVFHPGDTAWHAGPALDTPRGGAAVGALNNRLIVVGGATTDGAALDSVETLAAGAAAWADGAPLAQKRAYASAVVGGGRIWVAGGRTEGVSTALRGVESWPGGDANWRAESSLNTKRAGAAAAGVCIAGGENGDGTVGSVECIAARKWSARFELAVPRHGLGAGVIDGWLHVIGGGSNPGNGANAAHEVFDVAG